MKKLNARQRLFIAAYLKLGNGTKAAIEAGYSKKTAQEQSSRLLSKAIIQKEIEKGLHKVEEKTGLSVQWVLDRLKEVAERSMTHEPVMEYDHEAKEMVQKKVFDMKMGKWVGVYEFDSSGANKALELIGKNLKMFTDRIEHTVNEAVFERLERARTNAG